MFLLHVLRATCNGRRRALLTPLEQEGHAVTQMSRRVHHVLAPERVMRHIGGLSRPPRGIRAIVANNVRRRDEGQQEQHHGASLFPSQGTKELASCAFRLSSLCHIRKVVAPKLNGVFTATRTAPGTGVSRPRPPSRLILPPCGPFEEARPDV